MYFARIHALPARPPWTFSSSSASFASWTLRLKVRSRRPGYSVRMSCIVSVEPPCSVLPELAFLKAARTTPSKSTPLCW